ncbi:MAG: DMT family transporter [Deltaproteobacteria bacterium]|nr:DMT family transporter [Deltaproteobacteria bacterium]MBW2658040.1 DMT family transporter [Deltaproteobacteria bacterium]
MKYYIYAMGAILCWASLPVATGSGLSELTTEELMFYSFSSAALFLYLQDIVRTKSVRVEFPGVKISLLGVWGIFFYHYMYYIALDNAPLAEGAILATTWSFWVVVFSSLFVFGRLKLSIFFTALLGLFGAGLVIAAGKDLAFNPGYIKGYLLALLCGLIWSSFSVALSRIRVKNEPMTAFTLYAAILSATLFIITLPHGMPSFSALLSACYLGCVPLGLSFFLWNRAMSGGNIVIIGFLSYLTPPLAVLFVAIIEKEVISGQVLLGMSVILAASLIGRVFMKKPD